MALLTGMISAVTFIVYWFAEYFLTLQKDVATAIVAAVGTLAALVAHFTIVVERVEQK